jgi:hypothetical protein
MVSSLLGQTLLSAIGIALIAAAAAGAPSLSISFANEAAAAAKGNATVVAKVEGFELVDSASVHEQPRIGQGHLHYRVDDGPVIATTATKLSFHELSVGKHRVEVQLVGNDHQPIAAPEVLNVTIPASAAAHDM